VELAVAVVIASMFATPGIKLLRLRLRNGTGPEGWLSLFFFGLAIGTPLRLNLAGNPDVSVEWLRILSGVALIGLTGAAGSLTVFTWRVFRPASGIAKFWTGLTICVFAATGPVLFAIGQMANQIHPISMVANLWAISAFAWTFSECLNYYMRMRRQARVGLGDPVVQNRFLLWSIWTGSFVALPILTFSVKLALLANTAPGEKIAASVAVMTFIRVAVLVCSSSMLVSIWLSFFAPERYLVRIRGEQSAA
jgi:hypothetical protein